MVLSNLKKMVMIVILSGFVSNSFAAWGYHKSSTTCRNGNCYHKSVNKGCVNGHCGSVRKGYGWRR